MIGQFNNAEAIAFISGPYGFFCVVGVFILPFVLLATGTSVGSEAQIRGAYFFLILWMRMQGIGMAMLLLLYIARGIWK
jgi:hypothetical protein